MDFPLEPSIPHVDMEQIGALVCLSIGVFFVVRIARMAWRDAVLRRFGRVADGRIARVIAEYESYRLIVRFTDAEGGTHDVESDLSESSPMAVGAPVQVLYDSRRPERARISGRPASRAFYYALLLASAGTVVYVGVMMWRSPY